MLRIVIIFGALTGLLWLADRIDTPDTVPAIKPLLWVCGLTSAALLVRFLIDRVHARGRGGARSTDTDAP